MSTVRRLAKNASESGAAEAEPDSGLRAIFPSGGINLASGTVPVLIAVSALIGTAVAAFQAGGVVHGYAQDRIDNAKRFSRIEVDLTEIRQSITQMRDLQRAANVDSFRRREFDIWCRQSEKDNKGWKCPPL